MKVDGRPYRTIWLNADGWGVDIIDQRWLPHEFRIVTLRSVGEAATAIRDMWVRGAPLIGATAAYGMAIALAADASDDSLRRAARVLGATRPGYARDELTVLRRRVGELQAIGRGVLAELGALPPAAVAELVAGLVGGRPGKRLLELVVAAGGNPFYATELVGSLQRSNALTVGAGGWRRCGGMRPGRWWRRSRAGSIW